MKLTPTTAVAALVVIGAGGFMAGRISSSAPADGAMADSSVARSSRQQSSPPGSASEAGGSKKAARTLKTGRGEMATSKTRLAKLESIVRGENSLERNRALLDYLDQLAPGEFQDAVAHFRSLGITEARMGEYSLLLTAWAEADPTSALDFAKENTRNGFAQDTILTTWATTHPEAAIQWAKNNFEGEGANPYMAGIIRGLSQTDPTRATALLTEMPRSGERGKGLEFMLPHYLERGAEATQAWISSLGDDSLKNGAMMRVADRLAASDPAGTVSWMLQNPGDASQRRMDDVYSVWAGNDRNAAMASFSQLPNGQARTDALRGLIGNVASENPKEALTLLNRYPNDVTDRVVTDFVWRSFRDDPALATAQIARIGNEQEREQMYRRTLDNWIERDPASATTWIQSNAIPDSVRDRANRRLGLQQ